MTHLEFKEKWSNREISQNVWSSTSDHLFWARAYYIPEEQLLEMSKDFLSLGVTGYSSSVSLAKRVVSKYESLEA